MSIGWPRRFYNVRTYDDDDDEDEDEDDEEEKNDDGEIFANSDNIQDVDAVAAAAAVVKSKISAHQSHSREKNMEIDDSLDDVTLTPPPPLITTTASTAASTATFTTATKPKKVCKVHHLI